MRFRVSEFRNSLYTMPRLCPHGREDMKYIAEWETMNAGLPSYMYYMECPCLPPSRFAHKVVASRRQEVFEAQAELEKLKIAEVSRSRKETAKADIEGRWYFITFTQPDTDDDPHALLKRTEKVIKSKMVAAKHWCYTLELTEKGIPHTHIRLYSEKYFDYKKVANFNAGYRAEVVREKWDSGKYIVKTESKPSVDWLKAKALPGWLWSSDEYWHTTGAAPPS